MKSHNLSEQPRQPINYLVIGFVIMQLIFIAAILFSVFGTPNSDAILESDLAARPHVTIDNLNSAIPNLPASSQTIIEYDLFEIIKNNISEVNINTAAELRTNSIKTYSFPYQQINYISAIVDLPELQQSYHIFHEYSENENNPYLSPNSGTITLCLGDEEEKIYPDFICKDIYEPNTRHAIVANYIGYFDFKYFSAFLYFDNPDTIVIGPASYDNDKSTEDQYINEVKNAVESLGFSPDSYKYHVRTAADIDYNNL